jgi:hypothetical protein
MKKKYLLALLAGAAFLCGCNKQAKINSQKIDILSQKIVQLEQSQSKQMAEIQSELNSLAPMLDKMNDSYFEKNHEDAYFYHTNTLFLLLTIGKKIQAQLQTADIEREAQNSLAYNYHTNQLGAIYLCTAQIEDALASQESRIEDNVNAQTRQMGATLSDTLQKQIASYQIEIAAQKAAMAQIQHDLDMIKVRLGITNQPAARL